MAKNQIYPVVLSRDAAATIELTLESLREFPEVIVYECGSGDRTRGLCRRYPNVQFVDGEYLGNGRTRNQAASLADGDWILALDADEHLGSTLLADLEDVSFQPTAGAYAILRHNLFMGKEIRWGGWGNVWEVRLYNRRCYSFDDAIIDERIALPKGVEAQRLRGALWHQSVTDLDQLLDRIRRTSELRRHSEGRMLSPPRIVLSAAWAFFRSYFIQLGLLEGSRGLVIAVTVATETFFRHMKRYSGTREDALARRGAGSR